MPSDCQCSSSTQYIEKKVYITPKEARERMKKLEAEVEKLKRENRLLKSKLSNIKNSLDLKDL